MTTAVRKFSFVIALVLGALVMQPDGVKAAILQDLLDGESFVVSNTLFDQWELFSNEGTVLPDLSQIDVLPLGDQPFNPGITFNANGQLSAIGFNMIDLSFGFRVSTLSGVSLIKDNSLQLEQFSFGDNVGLLQIREEIFDAEEHLLGFKSVLATSGGVPQLFDSAEFAPQSEIFIKKHIFLVATLKDGPVSLDMFTQRFSQIPLSQAAEPSTLALWSLGVLALIGVGWLATPHKGHPTRAIQKARRHSARHLRT